MYKKKDKSLTVNVKGMTFRNVSFYAYLSMMMFGLIFLLFAPLDDSKPLISRKLASDAFAHFNHYSV